MGTIWGTTLTRNELFPDSDGVTLRRQPDAVIQQEIECFVRQREDLPFPMRAPDHPQRAPALPPFSRRSTPSVQPGGDGGVRVALTHWEEGGC